MGLVRFGLAVDPTISFPAGSVFFCLVMLPAEVHSTSHDPPVTVGLTYVLASHPQLQEFRDIVSVITGVLEIGLTNTH